MKHGELGLGGLEEEIITVPRISPFPLADQIVQGNYDDFPITDKCFVNSCNFLSTAVGCGDNHTILIMKDGKLYSFGQNDFGQLGHGKSRTRPGK